MVLYCFWALRDVDSKHPQPHTYNLQTKNEKKNTSIRSGQAPMLCAKIGSVQVNDQKRTNKAKFQVEFNVIPDQTGQPKQCPEHIVHPVVL